jgi:hypothetical protein
MAFILKAVNFAILVTLINLLDFDKINGEYKNHLKTLNSKLQSQSDGPSGYVTKRRVDAGNKKNEQCMQICDYCEGVLSRRWSVFCPLQCETGGQEYEACVILWRLKIY